MNEISLRQILDDGALGERFSRSDLIWFFAQASEQLAEAHERGQLHRDLTPEKIFLRGAEIFVKGFSAEPPPRRLGTPGYLAPEVLRGDLQSFSVASDLFSLGAVLYECLCGRRAFGVTPLEARLATLEGRLLPPHEVAPSCPEGLSLLCVRLLAKQREHRLASAREVLVALAPFLVPPTISLGVSTTPDLYPSELLLETPLESHTPTPQRLALFGPRFSVRRLLHKGAYSSLYEAYDQEREEPVAIKLVKEPSPSVGAAFREQFLALSALDHPNLVRLHELFTEEGSWFFSMELLDGQDLFSYLRGEAPRAAGYAKSFASLGKPRVRLDFDEERLRDALIQIASGLSALHAIGRAHQNLKPSNLLVIEPSSEPKESGAAQRPRVVLVDCGVVVHDDTLQEEKEASASLYMAPEQSVGQASSPEADWYSLGVLLYQALTGQPPFLGSVAEVSRQKQSSPPKPPRERNPEIPAALDSLCMALLQREPSLRPRGDEVMAALGVTTQDPPPLDRRPHFVGRREEQNIAVEALRQATPKVLVLLGESGLGKTSLLREIAAKLSEEEGALVLSGSCPERPLAPYPALSGIVRALGVHLSQQAPSEVASLPKEAALCASLFPSLLEVPAILALAPSRRGIETFEERQRACSALKGLFSFVAEKLPLVLCLDDLQWIDPDSLALVQELVRPPEPVRLLLLLSIRASVVEPKALAALSQLHIPFTLLPLKGLSAEESLSLLEAEGARGPSALRMAACGGGNPLLLQELARSKEETGASLEALLSARIGLLPNPIKKLLELLVVAEAPLPLGVAASASKLSLGELSRLAGRLESMQLARPFREGQCEALEVHHESVRAALAAKLSEESKRSRHVALVQAFSEGGYAEREPQRLVYHLEHLGERAKAAALAYQASQRAYQVGAFEQAAHFGGLALRLGSYPREEERRLKIYLGKLLGEVGRASEAAQLFLEARPGATPDLALELRQRSTQLLLCAGEIERGLEMLRAVMQSVQEPLPESIPAIVAALVWEQGRLRLRGLGYQERPEAHAPKEDLRRLDALGLASLSTAMLSPLLSSYLSSRWARLALELGEPKRVVCSLLHLAGYSGSIESGDRKYARALLQIAKQHTNKSDDPYLLGAMSAIEGTLAAIDWKLLEARTLLERGLSHFRESRDALMESSSLRVVLGELLYLQGDLSAVSRLASSQLLEGATRGNLIAETLARGFLLPSLFLAQDKPHEARRSLEEASRGWARQRFTLLRVLRLSARVEGLLYEGQGLLARALLKDQWAELERSMWLQIGINRCAALFLRGKSALCAARHNSAEAPTLFSEAEESIRLLEREKALVPEAFAASLRGGLASLRGYPHQATSLLEEATQRYKGAGMRLYAAACQRQLGSLSGPERGALFLSEADSVLRQQLVQNPARYSAMLVPI